jgi:dihydrofolate reductase
MIRGMGLTQYYTAVSLDGFIADEEHSLEWLFSREQDRAGPLNYADFVADVGAVAMGSTTYEWILEHDRKDKDPAEWRWPYDVPSWVFTHRRLEPVPGPIAFASGDVAEVHADMVAAAGGRNVWIVGGGDLAGQFADRGLLDEVVVAIAPVTLGGGAPLLPRRLELARVEEAVNGEFVCVRYDVVRT